MNTASLPNGITIRNYHCSPSFHSIFIPKHLSVAFFFLTSHGKVLDAVRTCHKMYEKYDPGKLIDVDIWKKLQVPLCFLYLSTTQCSPKKNNVQYWNHKLFFDIVLDAWLFFLFSSWDFNFFSTQWHDKWCQKLCPSRICTYFLKRLEIGRVQHLWFRH